MKAQLLAALVLLLLLAIAVGSDVRSRRIPNWLVGCGAAVGVILHGSLSPGAGLFSQPFGGIGILPALGGCALGLLLLLPMYALGVMGAGDVKLMAMVGAFVGPGEILGVMLGSLLAGGLLALLYALYQGSLRKVLANVHAILLGGLLRGMSGAGLKLEGATAAHGKLPYAVAIACGTVAYLLLTRLAGFSF